MNAQSDTSTRMAISNSNSSDRHTYSDLEYKICGQIARLVLIRLDDLVDGLDVLLKNASCQGEEFGSKSQSSPVHNQLDSRDGHDPDNFNPMAESHDEGLSSDSMDYSKVSAQELNSVQEGIEDTNQGKSDQCSHQNNYHPIEMIVLKADLIDEVEECGSLSLSSPVHTLPDSWDVRNPVKIEPSAESLDQGHICESTDHCDVSTDEINSGQEDKYQSSGNLNDQSSDHNLHPFEMVVLEPDNQILHIEPELITGETEEGLEKLESTQENNCTSAMDRIQNISPEVNTVNYDFVNENESIVFNTQNSFIGEQGSTKFKLQGESSNSYTCENNFRGQSTSHNQVTKSHTCDHCDYRTNSKYELTKHLVTHTGEKPFICDYCNKSFIFKHHLIIHLRIHTGEKPFICDYCNKSFTFKHHLIVHLRIHTGEKPFICKFCNKSFTDRSSLTRHLHLHTGETPFHCKFCNASFNLRQKLTTHLRTHTGERPFSCEFCNKSFIQKCVLTRHLHIHTRERLHTCEFCNKSFTQKSHLTEHLHTHTGEKPFSCQFCNKSFNQKSNLTIHLHTHTGERPFSCEFCNKSFIQKSYLTIHLHTHTGERPYTCEFCNKSFTQKSHLTEHLQTHTGEKPFSCQFCNKSFNRKRNLTRHLHTHTGE